MLSRRILVALVLASGCATGTTERETSSSTDAGLQDASSPDQSFGDGGTVVSPPGEDCPEASKSVYVIDTANMLRRFDPPSSTFSALGLIDCGAGAGSPFSMAVARDGTAWVLYTNGNLFKVSTKDASCAPSSFQPDASASQFGMGFVSDQAEGKSDTLFVASSQLGQLGKIALDTVTFTPIAPFAVKTRMELTGTGSGQLFALLAPVATESDSGAWTVAEISKSSGEILSEKRQSEIGEIPQSNFAVAAWGGDFYSFVGTNVYRLDTKANQVTLRTTVNFTIVGAGVSTCAPHALVK